ncbi:DUF2716 domain-containing protein [Listeria kieliensis]
MEILREETEEVLWKKVSEIYGFKNYSYKKIEPKNLIYTTKPISGNLMLFSYDENDEVSKLYIESGGKLKIAFERCFTDGIYILNWQHECYEVNSYKGFPIKDEDGTWNPNFLPEGDTVFFLSKDLLSGWIADFNNNSIILVGENFIETIKNLNFKFLSFAR